MTNLAVQQGSALSCPTFRLYGDILDVLHEICGKAIGLCAVECVAPFSGDGRFISIAQPCSRFDECLEHRPQIEGRTADNLEHVSSCGLLLERLAQIVGALAYRVEHARVLNRDHSLGS